MVVGGFVINVFIYSWEDNDIMKLIELCKNMPLMWQTKNPSYKKTGKKDSYLADLSQKMDYRYARM